MSHAVPRPVFGIALVSVAVMAFALSDVVGKHLTMLYAVPLVMFVRYGVNLALLLAVFGPRHGRDLLRTNRTGLVIVRASSLVVGSLTMGLALRYMPVAETVAIVYLSPFIVMILAATLMGETVGRFDWLGAALGFAGVMLIVRPGSGLDTFGVVLSLINACSAATYTLLSRVLAKSETMASMLVYTAGFGLVAFAVMTVVLALGAGGIGALPQGRDWAFMLALGVFATLGHFLITAAYREAPAALLAPVNYMHLIWAGLFGWLFFGALPDAISTLGMALIGLSGAGVALRAYLVRRATPPAILAPLE